METKTENLTKQVVMSLNDKVFNLIILPTEKCNFHCTYCYEDFSIGKMKTNVVEGIKKLLQKKLDDLDLLEISWFGGEPLLAKDIIYDISDFVLTNKSENLRFIGNITTNGYLLDERTFQDLISRNIYKYQISIDGKEELHNKTRKMVNGKGSFQSIWDNILIMHKSNFEFELIIRTHYTIDNYQSHFDLIELYNKELKDDNRIKIYFKSIEQLGGENDHLIKRISYKDKQEIKNILDSKLTNSNQVLDKYNEGMPYICYASKPNSLVVRANGKISKCTVALNDDRNNVGELTQEGKLNINNNLALWTKGFEDFDLQTLACPLSKINTQIKGNEK